MAEAERYTFGYKEIAEALIKKQGIHQGLWGIYMEFALTAVNINTEAGGGMNLTPAAIIPVQKMGIQQFSEPNNLTVDAAEVNPLPRAAKKSGGKKQQR